jgi:hypothetical protein
MTVDVCYCGGLCSTDCDYTSLIKYLCATWCGSVPLDCSTTMDRHSCVLLNDIVLIALKTISSVGNDYQLDG